MGRGGHCGRPILQGPASLPAGPILPCVGPSLSLHVSPEMSAFSMSRATSAPSSTVSAKTEGQSRR